MTFDLTFSDEQAAVRDLVHSIATDSLYPAARAAETAREIPTGLWQMLLGTGLTAPVAQEYGGGGVPDDLSLLLAAEGLGYGDPAITAGALWSGSAALLLGAAGTEQQRATLLPRFVKDPALRAAVALYEGFGRAPSEYRTVIQSEGAGWRVHGGKLAVRSVSSGAPLIVVGTDPTAGGRLRAAVLRSDSDGLTLVQDEPHIGLDAVPLSTLSVDAHIGADGVLGGPDSDPAALAHTVSLIRLFAAAVAVGAAARAREYASRYATERIAFGKPISSFQGVAFLMADAHMKVEAARLQVWRAATDPDTDPDISERAVTEAVAYATSIASEVTRDSIQVLGGHGYLTDHPVELWYRAAAGLTALDFDPTALAFSPAL